ncbi:roadblock/LC7 domain-containing protein [bacterium]|nr:roadblock/LC7 domain-containing protein [bacterium]
MEELLEKLLKINGVEGALVVGKDGLVISSVGNFVPDPDSFGASVAELLNHLDGHFQARGVSQRVTLDQQQGTAHLTAINEVTYLVTQGGPKVNLGRLRLDSDAVAAALGEQL